MRDTLVINCGSSSIKFALIHPQSQTTVVSGLAEKLNETGPLLTVKTARGKETLPLAEQGHAEAMHGILHALESLNLLQDVAAVGHRIVHGGEYFHSATRVNDEVLKAIEACIPLAPLHNPVNLLGLQAALEAFPDLPHVVVFDTAFHQTMPEHAYRYAVPAELYRDHGVRRYGFHGTSHQYVTMKAAEMLGKPLEETCFVSAHLGNGCSITAVKGGQSTDTSMGLTPLEGLVMGTRSGDVDPNLHLFLHQTLGLSIEQITDLLNKKSGLLGLSELSNDCRELEQARLAGHTGASLALEVFCYRLAKYVAAMAVPLGRLDALIFTGGIGENSRFVREKTLSHLGILGLRLDPERNAGLVGGQSGPITLEGGTPALVVGTNEELMIALQTEKVLT
ncbi:acetate kinase [Deinococcus cellulosilyticus]|uniref:Acetate kinase n=1 Tax=Deinococcus cellulosilyticus (strain DSM 18568 / NBRC 106333 / KACC 11606 / 5516J-15) TaxID=1223518 RepID=A0A511N130_DEIC1|nr:acetate kinase [Deinococcus cellulosilyticus]GEM46158.1 acetate kinase [Deinococcus cellulosilyticus NBRC 106333 = KACC 11606]